jgi:hypothetical protein
MFSPLCDRRNEPQKGHDIEINITSLRWLYTILFISHIGELLLPNIIGIQTMVKIESSVKQTWENLAGPVFRIHFIAHICPQTIILAYERAKHRKFQEDKGIFKHEPTSNVDYNQDIEMEMEGLDEDEVEAIKMMAPHGSNVPDDTWSLPRGYACDWSKPTYPRNPELWKTASNFLTEALHNSGTNYSRC